MAPSSEPEREQRGRSSSSIRSAFPFSAPASGSGFCCTVLFTALWRYIARRRTKPSSMKHLWWCLPTAVCQLSVRSRCNRTVGVEAIALIATANYETFSRVSSAECRRLSTTTLRSRLSIGISWFSFSKSRVRKNPVFFLNNMQGFFWVFSQNVKKTWGFIINACFLQTNACF